MECQRHSGTVELRPKEGAAGSETTSNASRSGADRPQQVTLAALLLVFVALFFFAGPLLPGSEGVIAFGVVAGALTLVAAAGLGSVRRWGYVMALIVAGLTIALAILPLFASIPVALK